MTDRVGVLFLWSVVCGVFTECSEYYERVCLTGCIRARAQ